MSKTLEVLLPPEGVYIVSYVDDCTILATCNVIDDLRWKLKSYLAELARFFTGRNITLSPIKSSATLFATGTKEVRLELGIKVDGTPIPTVNHPGILEVTFDSLLSFSPHTTAIVTKVHNCNKVLKSHAGSTLSKDKDPLLAKYKAIGRPVINCWN